MLRITDPTTTRCRSCGHPTVIAEFATGHLRVHCGTYRADCTPRRAPRSLRRALCTRPANEVYAA